VACSGTARVKNKKTKTDSDFFLAKIWKRRKKKGKRREEDMMMT